MADFNKAWPILLAHEGGYTVDDGGPTNWGWTLPALAKIGMSCSAEQLQNMTQGTAAMLYQEHYWNGFGGLKSDLAATKMLDMAVNMEDPVMEGQTDRGQAIVVGQRAVNYLLRNDPSLNQPDAIPIPSIGEDGVWGPVTLNAMNAEAEYLMVRTLKLQQAKFYRGLAASNPAKFQQYLPGWLVRASWPLSIV